MKQQLLGTGLGRFAMRLRSSYDLISTVLLRPENIGGLANDQLAERLLTRLCRPGMTFIDVGAHIGSIIAAVQQSDPSVSVIAFEAIPEKAIALRRKFQGVEVHQCAVGERDGEVSFFVNTRRSGYSSLIRPAGAGDTKTDVVEIHVPLKRMDDLISVNGVDVIKIDVEGAELGVLRGAEALISRCRPSMLFESAPVDSDASGYTKEALWQWFDERRYCVLVPNRLAHNDDGLGLEGFIESHLYPRRTSNYFAVPRERRTEIRDRARNLLAISAR